MNRERPRNKKPIDKRQVLFMRSGGRCMKCGKELQINNAKSHNNYATIDHIIPKSKGGTNNIENLQLLCRECNMSKSSNTSNVKNYKLNENFLWEAKEY